MMKNMKSTNLDIIKIIRLLKKKKKSDDQIVSNYTSQKRIVSDYHCYRDLNVLDIPLSYTW